MFEFILLPVLSFFAGFLPLFGDISKKGGAKISLALIMALLAICTGYFGNRKNDESKDAENKLNEFIQTRDSACANLSKNDKSNVGEKQNIADACTELKKSYKELNFIQATREKKIKVEWYVKKKDDQNIPKYLGSLGLDVTTPKNSKENTSTVNSIWYGSQVDLRNVKEIAYTLIATGAKLNMIRSLTRESELENPSEHKELVVQVGGDVKCINDTSVKVEEIKKAKEFPSHQKDGSCPKSILNL
jgi:hypothetical protein